MPVLTTKESKMLNALGRSNYGPQLVDLLKRLENEMSSIDGIQGDYAAQVEGRKLFKILLKDLLGKLDFSNAKPKSSRDEDDFT